MKAPLCCGMVENFGQMVHKKLATFSLVPKANKFDCNELKTIDKVKAKKAEIW